MRLLGNLIVLTLGAYLAGSPAAIAQEDPVEFRSEAYRQRVESVREARRTDRRFRNRRELFGSLPEILDKVARQTRMEGRSQVNLYRYPSIAEGFKESSGS